MKKIIIAAFFMAAAGSAYASCESGYSIQTKSDDGTILTLDDGSVWRVIGGGEVDSALWMDMDDILLCDDSTIINTDENNEQVSVELLSR